MQIHTLVPRRFGRRLPTQRSVRPVSRYFDADFDRLFDAFSRAGELGAAAAPVGFAPNVDVSETDAEIVISAELPGLEEKDFEVNLEDDVLTLKGEKRSEREETEHGTHRVESTYGAFERSFRLPEGVDPEKVSAAYQNGVLRVTIAKPEEAQPQTRAIPVTTG